MAIASALVLTGIPLNASASYVRCYMAPAHWYHGKLYPAKRYCKRYYGRGFYFGFGRGNYRGHRHYYRHHH